MDTAGGAVAAVSSIVAAANQTTSSPVPASSSPSANVIIHGNQNHSNVGAGVGGHHDHHHHHHSSLVHSNIISSASNSSSSSSNSSNGSLIIGHGSAGGGGNIAGGGSSNSSTSSNSSGYGSTSATPTNSYESHGTPTTPVAIAEPIIPVATVATVTPFYSEAINHQANNTQNYSAQQQPQYQLNSASQHLGQPAVPQHSQTNLNLQHHHQQQQQSLQQHQLQPQLQHSQRSQPYTYPTAYDYNQQYQQDSSLLTHQQQIHPGSGATAYGLGVSSSSGNFDSTLQSNSLTPYQQSMGHSYKLAGPSAIPYERQRSSSGHLGSYQNDTTASKHSQPFGSSSASAASNASASSGSSNLSASKSRSSTSLLGSMSSSSSSSGNPTSSVATTKPQAAATPFYAQPLAQAQTASASSYYAELQKHKMPLDYHHDQFGNFPNASAAAYHQQQKYYAAAKSQLKEAGSYGSTPAKSLYHNANSFYGGSMAQHGASSMLAPNAGYMYASTAYPTALGYESSSLDAVYRKSSATAPTLNSSTWHWGMDYAAGGNSRTTAAAAAGGTAPPPTAAGHLPTATVAPTHASYLAPANTSHRDPYYMTADKYAMKYDKYPAAAPPPPYQQNAYVSPPATRHHHHLWPGGGHNPLNDRLTTAAGPPPHSHVPHAGMHGSVNPYYSTNPAAAGRQPCCPQPPYQTQNCYYPPTAAVPPPPPTGRITHGQPMANLSQLTAAYPNQQSHMNQSASKYPASGLDYPPLNVNKLKTPNDLYLGTHHYDAATANPPTHTHLSHHRHPTGYQYGAAAPTVPGNQQLYTSNPQPHHPAHGQQPAGPLIAHDPHGSGYTNDLTTSYDSYLHEPISNSNSAAMGLGGAAAEMAATNYAVSTAKRALLDYRKPVTQTPPGDYYRQEQTGHRENAHPNYGGASHHHATGDLLLNTSETTSSFNEYDSTAAYGHEAAVAAAADNQSKPASDDSTKNLSLRDFIANWNDDEDDYATGNEELMGFDQQQGSGVINEMLQNVNVESSHDDTTNLLQGKPLKAAEVPQASVSTLPEDMDAQQYANLPDIIVDIEKSSNVNTFGPIADAQVAPNVSDMEKSTLNNLTTATGAQVAPNVSGNPTALSLDNFDVEKELDQLQQLQRKTGEDSVIVKPSQHNNVSVPGENPKSDITPTEENPQLTFEDLNLENAKTNNVPPASSATRPSATSVSNDAEGYDSGCSRHSNESSLFEKEYETFINKISTSCENLSKADKDIEQKVQDFSKFYKRKRKLRDESSKKSTEDLAMQDNKKSRNEAPNSPKESNFPQVYTKKSRNRTTSNASNKMAPKRRRKPSSFYYKAMQNIRRYPQHRCQMVRDYMADLKEKHLPLIKRQSIKNYSMQASPEAGDEELRPLPLKTLVLGVINSEDFRERFVISTMEMEEEEVEEDCTTSEEKHICPDPSCETCEVIRSLMESQEVDAAAAAAVGDVNNFQTDVVKLSDEEIKNLASTEEIIVAKEVEDLSEGKVVLIPELPGEDTEEVPVIMDVTKPEEETMIAGEQLAAQILEQELAQKDFRENLSSTTGGVIRKADLTTIIQPTNLDVETFNPSFQAIDSTSDQPKIPILEGDKPTFTNEISTETLAEEDLTPPNPEREHPAPKDLVPEQRNPVIKIVNSYPNKEESPGQLMVQNPNSEPREEPDQPSPKPIDSPRATSVIRKIETKPSDHDFEVKKKCYDRPDLNAGSPQALPTTVIRKAKGKSQQSEENSNSPKPQTSSDEKSQKVKEKSAKNPPIILRIKAQTTTVIRKHVTANPEGSEPKESASSYINKTFTVSKVSPNKSDSEESSDSESESSNTSSSSSENSDEERDESHSSSASDSDTDAEPENETLKTLRKVVEKCEKLSKIHETQKLKTETGDKYKTKGMLKEFNPTPADLNEDSKFSEESDVREVVASSPKLENPEIPQDNLISSTLGTPKSLTPARSSRASEERELQTRSNEDEYQLSRASVLAASLFPEKDLVHAKCENNLVENEEAPLDLSRQLSPIQTPVEDCHHSPNCSAMESKEPLDFHAQSSPEGSGLENIKPQSQEQIFETTSMLNTEEERDIAVAYESRGVIEVKDSYPGNPPANDENAAALSPGASRSLVGLNFDDPLTKNSDLSVSPLDIICDESATKNQVQQFQNEDVFINETIAKHPELSILPLDITVDGSITKNQDQAPQNSVVPASTTNISAMDNPESAESSCNQEKQEVIELSEDSPSSEESEDEEENRNNQESKEKFPRTASEMINSENIVDITNDSTSDEDFESEDEVLSKPITPVKLRDLSDNESRPSSVDDANEPLFGNEDESLFNLVAKTPEFPVEALDESLKISLGLLSKETENRDNLKATIPGSIDVKENQKTQGAETDLQTGNDNESQRSSCHNLEPGSKIDSPLNSTERYDVEQQSSNKTLAHIMEPCSKSGSEVSLVDSNLEDAAHSPTADSSVLKESVVTDLEDLFSKDIRPNVQEVKCSTGNQNCEEGSTLAEKSREYSLLGEILEPDTKKTSVFAHECQEETFTGNRDQSEISTITDQIRENFLFGEALKPTSNETSEFQNEDFTASSDKQPKNSLENNEIQKYTPEKIESPFPELEATEEQQQTAGTIRSPTPEIENHVDLCNDSSTSSESTESSNQLPSIPQSENCVEIDREQQTISERIESPTTELEATEVQQKTPKSIASPTSEMEAIEEQQQTPESIRNPTSEMESHVDQSMDLMTSCESPESIKQLPSIPQSENCVAIDREQQETSEKIESPIPELETTEDQQKTPERIDSPTSEMERHVELSNDSTTSSESADLVNKLSSIQQPENCIENDRERQETTEINESPLPELEMTVEQQKTPETIASPTSELERHVELSNDSTTSSESMDSINELASISQPKNSFETDKETPQRIGNLTAVLETTEEQQKSPKAIRSPTPVPQSQTDLSDDSTTSSESSDESRSNDDQESMDLHKEIDQNVDDLDRQSFQGLLEKRETDAVPPKTLKRKSNCEEEVLFGHDNTKLDPYLTETQDQKEIPSPKPRLEESNVSDHESDTSSQSSSDSSSSDASSPKRDPEENIVRDHESDSSSQSSDSSTDSESTFSPKEKTEEDVVRTLLEKVSDELNIAPESDALDLPKCCETPQEEDCFGVAQINDSKCSTQADEVVSEFSKSSSTSVDVDAEISHRKISNNVDDDLSVPDERENVPTCSNPSTPQSVTLLEKERTNSIIQSTAEEILGQDKLSADLKQEILQDIAVEQPRMLEYIPPEIEVAKSLQEPLENENIEKPIYSVDFDGEVDTDKSTAEVVNTETNSLNLDPEVGTEISGIVESSGDPKIGLDIQSDTCTVSNSKEDSPNNDEFEPQDSQKEISLVQDASLSQSAFLDDSTSTTKIEVMETAASQIPAASFTKFESQERTIGDTCADIDFEESCKDVFNFSTSANRDEEKPLDCESNSVQESQEVLLMEELVAEETRQQETKDKLWKEAVPAQEEGSTGDSPKTTEETYSPSKIQEDSEEVQKSLPLASQKTKQPDEVAASSAGSTEFIKESTESELKVQPEVPEIPYEATEKEVESNAEVTENLAEAIQTEDRTIAELPQFPESSKESEVQEDIIIAEEPREPEVPKLAEEPSDSEPNTNQEVSESVEEPKISEETFTSKEDLAKFEEAAAHESSMSPKAISKVADGLEDVQVYPLNKEAADKDPMSPKEISNITHGVEDPQNSPHDKTNVISSPDLEVPKSVSVGDHLPESEESKIEEVIVKSTSPIPSVKDTAKILKKSPLPQHSREASPEMNFWNTKGKYRALRSKRNSISKSNNESKRFWSRKKNSKAISSQSETDESSDDQDFILESQEKNVSEIENIKSLSPSADKNEVIESQEILDKRTEFPSPIEKRLSLSADQNEGEESEKFAETESADLPKLVPLTADQFEIDLDDIPLPPPRSEEIKSPEIGNPRQDVTSKYHSVLERVSSPIESAKTLSAGISKSVNTPNDSSPAGAYNDAEISSNSPDETTENYEEIAMVLSPKEPSRTLSEDISSSENTPTEDITGDKTKDDKFFNITTKAKTDSYGETILTSHHRRTSSPNEPRKSLSEDLSSSVNTPIGANPAETSISSTDAVVENDGGEIVVRSDSQETSSQSEARKSLYEHISNSVNTPSATCPADEPLDVSNSVNPANESNPAEESNDIRRSSILGDANSQDGIDLAPKEDISGRENTPNERSPDAEISLEHSNVSADIAADGDNEIARVSSPNEHPKTPTADISCDVNTTNECSTADTTNDFLSCKFQTSFDEGSDFNGFEDPHEEELLRREVENLNEDSTANDGFQYAISHLTVNKSPSKSSEIDELEALEKELSQQCLAQQRDESKTEVDLDLVDRQGNNETEPQRVSLTNVSISTNDIEHIKKMLESDEEPANEENETNASDDDTPQNNASGLECKENISSTNLCVIPKLSDLCRAALNSSLNIKNLTIVQSNANANDEDDQLEVVVATEMQAIGLESSNATPQNLLVERELSVEEALAEMYRQAGVLLSDPEDNESDKASITHNNNTTTNTTTAVAPNQDLLLINLHEILNSSDNDVYVLQCDISGNSNNNNNTTEQSGENNANSDENQEIILPTERFNTLQLIGIVNRDNEGSEIHIISSDSESEVIILSDCDTDVEFQPPQPPPKCFSPRPPHREYIPFITDYEDQSSDSMSDLSTIHHEEIVPDNLNKFLQEEFFKYLHEKYAQKKLSRYYHANRVLKKYKKTRLLNKYRS